MTAQKLTLAAKAEQILNRTLAYQAAIAVHDLKDRLDLDVAELRLVVAPESPDVPGCYRVICTIARLAEPGSLTLQAMVRPDQAATPIGKMTKATAKGRHAKSTSHGGAR